MVLEIIPIKIQREIGIDTNFVDLILELNLLGHHQTQFLFEFLLELFLVPFYLF